ncbi:MAG: hypothetical protein A2Z21_00905 [Candidatus Fraserbacteria bacterium RBG_16_55_9]|uniref:ABC transmembrane type-1 domain-containing protein n=1 Tax=Fraserbacteria sp. (strain RBG_16_55_9) TaxID=1817864 RepID=A0A1F5V2U7_FRAXR|nr:MAG: hypothetical protein A2Z21_00905 [Candidatus Fraserbacteria bacterium RBG_16_55_9]
MAAAAVVFVASALISLISWVPLSLPSRFISAALPQFTCAAYRPGTLTNYMCAAGVALMAVAGPVLVIFLLFVLRAPLAKGLGYIALRLPKEMHFFLAPLLATALYTIAWAGVHYATATLTGILPQIIFPAVIGLFTYAVARYGSDVQRALTPLLDYRDRFPKWARILAAIAIPLVLSLLLTLQERVTQETLKEQGIVLIALCTGYLALAPRSGDFWSGAERFVSGEQSRV